MTFRFTKGDWPDTHADRIAVAFKPETKIKMSVKEEDEEEKNRDATIFRMESGSSADFIEIYLTKNNSVCALYDVGMGKKLLTSGWSYGDVIIAQRYHVIKFQRSGANASLQVDDGNVSSYNTSGLVVNGLNVFELASKNHPQVRIEGKGVRLASEMKQNRPAEFELCRHITQTPRMNNANLQYMYVGSLGVIMVKLLCESMITLQRSKNGWMICNPQS
ncbi:hypothetical protein HELRODRAFT_173495 [Helobdella robusta]|uniref:Laminin G domain-containing protein n=1 Tax=Helobdella robusta TaxID=6412 RepID=T1F6W1_HELRO|nr:hypothetical protein HELRODRAFT_173495 [Helobdella robusta]ESO03792.1 hypothetical protein HELRODRAFT_173495 [Helobdella robusta]